MDLKVPTLKVKFDSYKRFISPLLFRRIKRLAKKLKGLKVIHLNSTAEGGGVAEVLKSLVPLMQSVGIKAEWYVLPPNGDFFEITKNFHNALQGKKWIFEQKIIQDYLAHIAKSWELLKRVKADIWVIHDPQPIAIISYLKKLKKTPKTIWRCHIDTTNPDKTAWDFFVNYIRQYNKIIFSRRAFVHQDFNKENVSVFTPAIDPLIEKNKIMDLELAKKIVGQFGININHPLICQVSRFDPWKDPKGVIQAFRLAKKEIKNLQLAYLGLILAQDDPEAVRIYQECKEYTQKDKDVFLFADPKELGTIPIDLFVNSFQRVALIILQKSIREGFGLSVAEAMWKGKTVIGGNVGGIKSQIKNNKNGFLVNSPQQCAQKIIQLIKKPKLIEKISKRAQQYIKKNFLMPRLLKDYLLLFDQLMKK